jgi:sugar phosphate isomerase/epimerase
VIGFSCGDQSWASLPHQSAVELIALLGFEAIDLVLGVNPRHLLASDVAVRPSSLAAELAPLLERHSLRVADVFVGPLGDFETLAPNHPDESQLAESRELFLAVLEFADALGSPGITQVPGLSWPGEAPEQSLQRAVDELSARADLASTRGLGYSIEAHLGSVVEDIALLRVLLEAVPSLDLTLDPSHLQAQGVEVPMYSDLFLRTRHLHMRGAKDDRPQVAMSDNEIDLSALAGAMFDAHYPGCVCLEYVCVDWRRCNECDVLTETLLLRDALRVALDGADDLIISAD